MLAWSLTGRRCEATDFQQVAAASSQDLLNITSCKSAEDRS